MPSIARLHKILDPEIRAKNLREARFRLRGMYWDLVRPSSPDPVFIIGCSRSGTTVTYETVSSSRELLSFGYEIPQFWNSLSGPHNNNWHSEAAVASDARPDHRDSAQRFFFQRLGRGRVVDKTCINVMRAAYLYRLFPQATFIYIHRDGRDNISSMIDGWRHDRHFGLSQFLGPSPEPVNINNAEFQEWSFFLPPGWRDYNNATVEEVCAYQWITANGMALEARAFIPPEQWIQLRYEDIFDRPVDMFRDVFRRISVTFDPELQARCKTLGSRPTSIVKGAPRRQKWREHNPQAIERILPVIRPMMLELGYDPDE